MQLSKSPAPTDLIGVQGGSTNVWIDHNGKLTRSWCIVRRTLLTVSRLALRFLDFEGSLSVDKDYYDGQVDITHAADFITVSWNVFHDSWKTSLIGHSEKNGAEDKGHLRVTYHHNYFRNVNSRLPSIRFGTLHAFNNYFRSVAGSAINLRNGAQGLVENCRFDNVQNPIETKLYKGFVVSRGNDFTDSEEPDLSGKGSLTKVPYAYELDPVNKVSQIVPASAGVGKVSV